MKNTRYDMTQSQSSLIYVQYTHVWFSVVFFRMECAPVPFLLVISLSSKIIQSNNKKFSFNIIMHILWLNIEYTRRTHIHTLLAKQNQLFTHIYTYFILIHFMFVHPWWWWRLWYLRLRTTRICWCCCCCMCDMIKTRRKKQKREQLYWSKKEYGAHAWTDTERFK